MCRQCRPSLRNAGPEASVSAPPFTLKKTLTVCCMFFAAVLVFSASSVFSAYLLFPWTIYTRVKIMKLSYSNLQMIWNRSCGGCFWLMLVEWKYFSWFSDLKPWDLSRKMTRTFLVTKFEISYDALFTLGDKKNRLWMFSLEPKLIKVPCLSDRLRPLAICIAPRSCICNEKVPRSAIYLSDPRSDIFDGTSLRIPAKDDEW